MDGLLAAVGLGVLLVGTEAFFTALSVVNLRHQETAVADNSEWIVSELGIDDPEEALSYHRVKTGVSKLQSWVTLGLLLLVLFSGLFADLVGALDALGLSPLVEGLVFVVGLVLAIQLLSVPFDVVDTFVVEEVYGFNNQTLGLWLRDQVIGTAISLVFAVLLGGALLWFVEAVPLWPAAGWGLVMAFTIAFTVIKPRVIDPLFNEFTPVEESPLRDAVDEVFERAGYRTDEVYEMDASRRSSHSNAYFVGFGPAKRVVLYDTLVEGMETDEVQSVLAHELAHWREGHIWKFVALGAVRFAVVFAVLGWLVESGVVYAPFAVPETAYVGLFLGVLWIAPLNRLTSPLENYVSLSYERDADAYAVEVIGGDAMARALAQLAADNLSTPFPHPWYETFHYDHPPIPERIRRVRDLDPDVDAPGDGSTDRGADPGAASD
ncbi:M48 family metallopeptidase [Halobaculum sp. MBLA0147]|uniref:M48 family metallopeptidase n=1 Tax=Halobaculum sp. MBLA0147 TaxID=3079934 RepID=UPI003523C0B7